MQFYSNNGESDLGHLLDFESKQTKYAGLWQAVLKQALLDASMTSKQKRRKKDKMAALDWLLNSEDFYDVCLMANIDGEFIRGALKKKTRGVDLEKTAIKLIDSLLVNVKS